MAERSDELPEGAWREITVAEGSQGPRRCRFSAQRVRPTSRRKPGEIHWAVYRRNLDGSERRHYLSNAPEDTPLKTLAFLGGSRWRIETEFETEKNHAGLEEYEIRTPHKYGAGSGRVGITTWPCTCRPELCSWACNRLGGRCP